MHIDKLLDRVCKKQQRFIVVTGGVCSSLGKGILTASIGALLKKANFSVQAIKCDPYLNIDPGTMSPHIHGEVFVTHDGGETDLDLGHYERMLDINLTKESSITAGQVFKEILMQERNGTFLGNDIQLVPHVVDEIKKRLLQFALKTEVNFILIEIGGTIGDIEGKVFLEAVRQLRYQLGQNHIINCHLGYVPYLSWAHEFKTKPTQQSVIALRKTGITCDNLFLRIDSPLEQPIIDKLSLMCGVAKENIFQVPTCNPPYTLLLKLYEQGVHKKIVQRFNMQKKSFSMLSWRNFANFMLKEKPKLRIGLVAKYTGGNEPYLSVIEALKSAAWQQKKDVDVLMINAQRIEEDNTYLSNFLIDGIVIPGGFGERGTEGKMNAVRWALEQKIPCFGLCLGLHVMLIEFARNLLQLPKASSAEFNPKTPDPIITLLDDQIGQNIKGGTMRLGVYRCDLVPGTIAYNAYQQTSVLERHRHRYEFNNAYREALEEKGVIFSGIYQDKNLIEIAELRNHPFMLGTQFHPEFLSRPLKPHPLFKAFMQKVIERKNHYQVG